MDTKKNARPGGDRTAGNGDAFYDTLYRAAGRAFADIAENQARKLSKGRGHD
ncbi:MAG: hypothetical protein Q8O52_18760 [Sulfuritalea sp.]|nr:hypothetical protein [Sulfuritalea sp.]